MFTMATLPLLVFSLLSLFPMLGTLLPDLDEPDTEPEPDAPDIVPIGDGIIPDKAGDPDSALSQKVLTENDPADEDAVVVDGSELRDLRTDIALDEKGRDDTIAFSYASSVDGGEGSDYFELTITEDALADGELEFGTVAFDDPADVLTITLDDNATGFLHEVRILSTEEPDVNTEADTETMFYILNQSDTLSVDQEASLLAGEVVFEDGAQVLAQVDLGTEVTISGYDEDGFPTETVTGAINDMPVILLNRAVSSQLSFTVDV